jgi:DNA polymerase III subunit beta
MKLFYSFNQKDLATILGLCNQVSPKKSDVDIFTFTKLNFSENEVNISAFNQSTFYSTKLAYSSLEKQTESYQCLIKTEILSSTVGLLNDDQVSIEIDTDKSTAVIQNSKSKHTLRINTDQLNNFVDPQKKTDTLKARVECKTSQVLEAIKAVIISVGQAKNTFDPTFLNICFTVDSPDNSFIIVATDRFRVTKTKVEAQINDVSDQLKEEKVNLLTLPKGLQLLFAFNTNQEELSFEFLEDLIWINLGSASIALRYSDGVYPDYDKIIPQSFTCQFTLNTKELQEALKQVYYFARTNTNNKTVSLQVKPEDKKIHFTSHTEEGFASESSVQILTYEGALEDWNQSFNSEFLIDYVSTIQTENTLWESNPSKPSVISPENQKDKQLYLISGLR